MHEIDFGYYLKVEPVVLYLGGIIQKVY